MKKFLKILAIVIAFVFVLILILPFFFKSEIVKLVKKELNSQVNAKIDFEDASLSMLRQFPDFTLDLNELSVVGNPPFQEDTLLLLESLSLRIDVLKAFNGNFELKAVKLIQPILKLKVLEDGAVNWDIALAATDTEQMASEPDTSTFELKLKKLTIEDGFVLYDDKSMNMITRVDGLDATIRGALSTDQSEISTQLKIKSLNVNYEGIPYLVAVKTNFQASFLVDLKNDIYTFKNNVLFLNDLEIGFDGSVGLNDDNYTIVLNYETRKTEFKSLLSLIPSIYATTFEDVTATGKFDLRGYVKGTYSETQMPAYGFNLAVNNAAFKYPEMPVGVNNINGKASVESKTGKPDDTHLNVEDFHFKIAENEFKMGLTLRTPVSDPQFDMFANGLLDFSKINKILPNNSLAKLEGQLQTDLRLKAKMSDIENERFNDVNASGSMVVRNFNYENAEMLQMPIAISNAQLNFSPLFFDLINTDMQVGKSDFKLNGRVENYLAYYLKDGVLQGNLDLKSTLIDVDELLNLMVEEDSQKAVTADTAAVSHLDLPQRLKLRFNAKIDSVIYNPYRLSAVTAAITYEDQRIVFDPLSADLLKGNVSMEGEFFAPKADRPSVALNFQIKNFDIPQAYQTIGLFREAAPVAAQATGNFSTSFSMKGKLDSELSPVYETLEGEGTLKTSQLELESISSLKKITQLLGTEKYDRMVTDGLNFSFEFLNGRIFQKPFNMNLGNYDAVLTGSLGFDKTLDYDMVIKVPFSELGGDIQSGISQLTKLAEDNNLGISPAETINVKARITGVVSDPKVSIDYKDYAADLGKMLKDEVNARIEKEKEALKDKLNEEVQKVMEQAENEAESIVNKARAVADDMREEGKKAAQQVRDEAAQQAANLIAEGKKNGMIAEMAAKKAAEALQSEAEKQALNIEKQANDRAQQIENQAQQNADKIIEEAQEKAGNN
ncbi:MAG: AsmA family protein [Bacteroidetes bacterium]|jgi:hypothetical protein|nr:AsmA family protein [Bacteroidota bacterium]